MNLAMTKIKLKIQKLYYCKILHLIMKRLMKLSKVRLLKICQQWNQLTIIRKIESSAVLYPQSQMVKSKCHKKAILLVNQIWIIYKTRKNHQILKIFMEHSK